MSVSSIPSHEYLTTLEATVPQLFITFDVLQTYDMGLTRAERVTHL